MATKPKRTSPRKGTGKKKIAPIVSKATGLPTKKMGEVLADGSVVPQTLQVLKDNHLTFCKRYVLNGGKIGKTAREVGMNPDYCGALLKDPLIQQEVKRYRDERAARFEVTDGRVILELAKMAFATLGNFITIAKDGTPIIDCEEVGEEEMAALAEITQDVYTERNGEDYERVKKTKIKLHSKLDALEKLGKILRLFGVDIEDKDTAEDKAAKIRAAMKQMREVDGLEPATNEIETPAKTTKTPKG